MLIDEEMTKVFLGMQTALKPKVVIEVGAFNAEFSQIVVNQNICDEIYAFEASPYVYERFKDILPSKIQYIHSAISDHIGVIPFEIQSSEGDPSLHGNNSILNRNENKAYDYVDVPCISLDEAFEGISDICLWIDVEGANREVLLGSSRLLKNVQSIFIETEHQEFWKNQWLHDDVVKYLGEHGFVMACSQEQYAKQTNCIFVHKNYLEKLGLEQ